MTAVDESWVVAAQALGAQVQAAAPAHPVPPPYIKAPGLRAHAESLRPLMPLARTVTWVARAYPNFIPNESKSK